MPFLEKRFVHPYAEQDLTISWKKKKDPIQLHLLKLTM